MFESMISPFRGIRWRWRHLRRYLRKCLRRSVAFNLSYVTFFFTSKIPVRVGGSASHAKTFYAGGFHFARREHWYQDTSPAPMRTSPAGGTHVSFICFFFFGTLSSPIRARRVSCLVSSEHVRACNEKFAPLKALHHVPIPKSGSLI